SVQGRRKCGSRMPAIWPPPERGSRPAREIPQRTRLIATVVTIRPPRTAMNKPHTRTANCALVAVLLLALPTRAISQESSGQATATTHTNATDDYRIAASDVLTVSVPDAPEFSGKFRVSDSGVIDIPGVSAPIRAEGQTAIELAHSIREALVDSKQLRDPRVSVFVEESHGRTITILGAVTKPSVYP